MSGGTFLESIAAQREATERAAEQAWQALDRTARRAEILDVLSRAEPESARRAGDSGWLLAADVAAAIGVPDTPRRGRGAVAGSWSGYRSAALRVVPMLRSLVQDGLVVMRYRPTGRTVTIYAITVAGTAWLKERQ